MDARKIDTANLLTSAGRGSIAWSAAAKLGEPMKVFLESRVISDDDAVDRMAEIVEQETIIEEHEQPSDEFAALQRLLEGAALLGEADALLSTAQSMSWFCGEYQWPTPWSAPVTQPGDLVYLHSLQSDKALNGRYGTVDHWNDASGRWIVWLSSTKTALVRPENLIVVRQQMPSSPEWHHGSTNEEAMRSHCQHSKKPKRPRRKDSSQSEDSESATESTAASTSSEHSGESSEDGGATSVKISNCPELSSEPLQLELFDEQNKVVDTFDVRMGKDSDVEFASAKDSERFEAHFNTTASRKIACAKVRRASSGRRED